MRGKNERVFHWHFLSVWSITPVAGKSFSKIDIVIIKFPFKRKACQVYEGGCCRQVSTVVSLVVW